MARVDAIYKYVSMFSPFVDLLFTETKKQSPNTGARANNTLPLHELRQLLTGGGIWLGLTQYIYLYRCS